MLLSSLAVLLVVFAPMITGQTVIQLPRDFQLDLRGTLKGSFDYPITISSFTADSNGLHLLVSPQQLGKGAQGIVDLDSRGNLLRVRRLTAAVDGRWLEFALDSDVAYLWRTVGSNQASVQPASLNTRIYSVDQTGFQKELGTIPGLLRYPAKLGKDIWGIAPSGCKRFGTPGITKVCDISAADPNGMSTPYRQFSPSELVAVEGSTATLVILDPETGRLVSKRIVSPEIQHAMNFYRTDPASAMIVGDIAVIADRRILAIVTGHPFTSGGVVLEIDGEGVVQRSVRCPLMTHDDLRVPGNRDGHMIVSYMGFSNSTLYLLNRNGFISACRYPSQ